MKTKSVFFALLLITVTGSAFGQNHYEALNLQAHTNRKATTVAEAIALRDAGTLPAATLANPCAALATVQAKAVAAGNAYRTAVVTSADVVNKEGATFYASNSTPVTIDWNNFNIVKSELDAHMIEIAIDFGANKPANISGSIWNNGVHQGFGFQTTTIQGVHNCHAWDYRKETGNPLAVFPFSLVDCNNNLGKDLLMAVLKKSATIGGAVSNNPPTNPPANNPAVDPADQALIKEIMDQFKAIMANTQATAGTGGTPNINFNVNIQRGGNIEGSGNSNSCNCPATAAPVVPNQSPGLIVFNQRAQLNPAMDGYVSQGGFLQSTNTQQLTYDPRVYQQLDKMEAMLAKDIKLDKANLAFGILGTIFSGISAGTGLYQVITGNQTRYPMMNQYQSQIPNFNPSVPGTSSALAFNRNTPGTHW